MKLLFRRHSDHKGGAGGRISSRQPYELLFVSEQDQESSVAILFETDHRPLYDAWESKELSEVELYVLPEGLVARVVWKEDSEWNTGGPATSYDFYLSTDGGLKWVVPQGLTGIEVGVGARDGTPVFTTSTVSL